MSIPDRKILSTREIIERIRLVLEQDIPNESKIEGIRMFINWNRRYHTRPRINSIREELQWRFNFNGEERKKIKEKLLPFLDSIKDEMAKSTSPFTTLYFHYFPLYYLLRRRKVSRPEAINVIFMEIKEKYYEAIQKGKVKLPAKVTTYRALDK